MGQDEVLAFLDDFTIPFDNKLYDCSSQRSWRKWARLALTAG
jgi:hypothetical protein